jgi:hypothetical protein
MKKILIVSDYKEKIWWIEIHIYTILELLKKQWYEVDFFWYNWSLKKWQRYLFLVFSIFNFIYAFKLRKKIKEFNPDIVRYHSVSRFIWRFPIFINSSGDYQKWIVYHDFGCFSPFPSLVTQEKEVLQKFSFLNYLSLSKTKNPFKLFFIILKYFNLILIKKQLITKIDKHIVPTKFVFDVIKKQYNLKEEKIYLLEHFV